MQPALHPMKGVALPIMDRILATRIVISFPFQAWVFAYKSAEFAFGVQNRKSPANQARLGGVAVIVAVPE